MAKFFRQTVDRVAGKQIVRNGQFINQAFTQASARFESNEKKQLLEDFDNHPVTKELVAGPNTNSSYLSEGDLFSFIGFEKDSNPTEPIKDILNTTTIRKNSLGARYTPGRITYDFPVEAPSLEEIENVTPQPFGTGKSWVRMLERGVNQLNFYIKRFLSLSEAQDTGKVNYIEQESRSGGGMQLQRERSNPNSISGRIKYITEIYEKFRRRLGR